jgi:WD40 repeat protein
MRVEDLRAEGGEVVPEELCRDCPELLPELKRLLGGIGQLERLMNDGGPAGASTSTPVPNVNVLSGLPLPGEGPRTGLPRVAGYELVRELGRGGMGVVYEARHLALKRLVALKMILAGAHAGDAERQRFRAEAEAVARLSHPNIVQVYEVGDSDGLPFLALEHVAGQSLAQRLRAGPLAPAEAARLVGALAGAMHLAHSRNVVHRDLKPANVLLSVHRDPEGSTFTLPSGSRRSAAVPKITDFGLARRLDVATGLTQTGAVMGTPSYMAPEQASGQPQAVGPAADVYALGAILYECLTGRPPFRGGDVLETLAQVRTAEPVPPRTLRRQVPRDLETICLKCLRKEPERRYASARELADDLHRFLDGEPIQARRVSAAGRVLRWARRNKAFAAALTSAALLLVLLAVGASVAAAYFRQLEQEQRTLAQDKARLADEKEGERVKAVEAGNETEAARRREAAQARELRHNLYLAEMNLAGQAAESPIGIGRVGELLAPWARIRPDQRGWEWYYFHGLAHRDLLTYRGHVGVWAVSWCPDGKRIASAGWGSTSGEGAVNVWDATTGDTLLTIRRNGGDFGGVSWSPDGTRLAALVRTLAGQAGTVWDAATGKEVLTLDRSPIRFLSLAWGPDGTRLATGELDGTVRVWDAATGQEVLTFRPHTYAVRSLAFSPDGKRLATGDVIGGVKLCDAVAGKEVLSVQASSGTVNEVAWSPDGTRLATASADQTVRVWETAGARLTLILRHADRVEGVAWSSDGMRLAAGGADRLVAVWDAATGDRIVSLRGHTDSVVEVAWSPDGTRLASASRDRTVKVWSAAPGNDVLTHRANPQMVNGVAMKPAVRATAVAWSRDGARLAAACGPLADNTIKVWEAATGKVLLTFRGPAGRVDCLTWSPDGTRLATGGLDRTVTVWDAANGQKLLALPGRPAGGMPPGGGAVGSVAWSPDGKLLASAGAAELDPLLVHEAATGKPVGAIPSVPGGLRSVVWSPDGKRLAAARWRSVVGWPAEVMVWDWALGREVLTLRGHTESNIRSVAWSADGTHLASAGDDGTVRVWDAASGQEVLTLRGHAARVESVAWAPDGTRLASGAWDRTVKVWDVDTGKEVVTFTGFTSGVWSLAWSPDGTRLAAASEFGTLLVYDAARGYALERSPRLLVELDRRLAADPKSLEDLRLRAEVHARQGDWERVAADVRQCLALSPGKPRWYATDAWVVGPYPADLQASEPPENDPDPGRPVPATTAPAGAESELRPWLVVPREAEGFVDFAALLGSREPCAAYALTRVFSPEKQRVTILLGSGDGVRLWLNGRLVHEDPAPRKAAPGQNAVPATLEAGWNSLLAKVVHQTGEHALYLRLSDPARPDR